MSQNNEHTGSNKNANLTTDTGMSQGELAPYLLAAIVESADVAIISKDLDSIITSWNQAAERIFGFTAEEAIGQPILIIIPAELQGEETAIIEKIRSGQRIDHYETIRRRRDGSLIEVSLTISPVKTPDGKVVGVSKIARDITTDKHAERRNRLVTDSLPVLVAYIDADERYRFVNRTYQEWFGVTSESALGKHLSEVLGEKAYQEIRQHIERALAGEKVSFENILNYKTGARFVHGDYVPDVDPISGQARGYISLVQDITEQKRTVDKLLESEERFRLALLSGAVTVYEQDLDLRYKWVYPESPYSPDLVGKTDLELTPGPDAERREALKRKVIETGESIRDEVSADLPDRRHWYDIVIEPRRDHEENIIGVVGTALDITEKYEAEERLKHNEASFRAFITASSDIVYRMSADWSELRQLDGHEVSAPSPEPTKAWIEKYVHPDDRARVMTAIQKAIEAKSPFKMEHRIVRSDGSTGWTFSRAVPMFDDKGEIAEWFGTATDVTERKLAEQALESIEVENERQRRFYDTILSNTPDLTYVFDLDHRFIYANDVLLRMWGKTWDEAIGKNCLELGYEPWHAEMHDREIEQVKATKQPIRGEVPFAGTFGRRIYDYIFVPIIGADGEVEAVAGTTRDVTDRKRTEMNFAFLSEISGDLAQLSSIAKIMQVAGAKIGEFLELSLCTFVEINENGDEAYVAHEWSRDDRASIIGNYRLSDYLSEDFQQAGRAGEVFVVRDVFADPRTDGEKFTALGIGSFVCVPIVQNGRWLFAVNTYDSTPREWQPDEIQLTRELTTRIWNRLERARAEEALRDSMERERAARQEAEAANRAKDEFLAILSHELRTPLHAMKGWSSLLRSGSLDEHRRSQAAEVIARNLEAQNALVDDLLDVSRIVSGKLTIEHEPVSFVSVIADVIEDLRPPVEGKGVRLKSELDATAGKIMGDQNRLRQIVTNLLNNAVKFTPPTGSVTIRLESAGPMARLTVVDTGVGISEDMLPRIFDRFQQADSTTRRGYGGLGLGLAIVKHLVELHGGTIKAESDGHDKGAKFTVDLPVIAPSTGSRYAAFVTEGNGAKKLPLAGRHILVVEDDPDSLSLLQVVLSKYGASVTTAASTAEAVTALEHHRFDLLISDLGLPDRDGFDLIATVRGQLNLSAEALPAAALSGYAAHEDRQRSTAAGYQLHVAKPLDLATFPTALLSLLANEVSGE